jgi:hypothetical protein
MRFKIINLILEIFKIILFQVLKQNKNYLIKKILLFVNIMEDKMQTSI